VSRRDSASCPWRERGSAAIEFVLISVPTVLLLLGVVQVGVVCYAQAVIAAATADGARYGANAGVGPIAGAARSEAVIAGHASLAVTCMGSADTDPVSHLAVSTVRCRGRLRLVFLPLPRPLWLHAQASVVSEPSVVGKR
jgi:hypothetical protein